MYLDLDFWGVFDECGFLFGFVGCSAWLVVWMGVSGGDWVCGS